MALSMMSSSSCVLARKMESTAHGPVMSTRSSSSSFFSGNAAAGSMQESLKNAAAASSHIVQRVTTTTTTHTRKKIVMMTSEFEKTNPYAEELKQTAAFISQPGKGILASDESNATTGKRLATVGLDNTVENRQAWRELLYSAPGLGNVMYNTLNITCKNLLCSISL
jgi:hypothetical protein